MRKITSCLDRNAQAKSQLSALLRNVEREQVVIHDRGRDVACLVSIEGAATSQVEATPFVTFFNRLEAIRKRVGLTGVTFAPVPAVFRGVMANERYLLDTNVVSELARPAPASQVVDWLRGLNAPATSAIVCYKLARGIERLSRGKRRTYLEAWFAEFLRAVETLPVDEPTALAAARIESAASRKGRSLEVRDLLIAATAQVHGCAVATRNVSHFAGLGVIVYDPFSDHRTM